MAKRILEEMREALGRQRDSYILFPNGMESVAVPLRRMQKDDEEGNLLDGEYYSLQDLSEAFGNQYTIQQWVDENHSLATWTRVKNNEMSALSYMLVHDFGLIDILDDGNGNELDDGNGNELDVEDVDWSNIPENGFAIFTYESLIKIPKMKDIK